MKRAFLLCLAGLTLVGAVPATAAVVTREDAAGRTITFDVPRGTSVDGLAAVLGRSLHGDEIESVAIRLVSRATLTRSCGSGMASCYRSEWRDQGEILLPAHGGASSRFVLLHEYAHHLDETYGLTSWWRRGPSAYRWWAARRIEQRLRSGEVTWDYEFGWQRSIGEILAEDYVQLHMRPRYGIRWLRAPSQAVLVALRRDIRSALRGGR